MTYDAKARKCYRESGQVINVTAQLPDETRRVELQKILESPVWKDAEEIVTVDLPELQTRLAEATSVSEYETELQLYKKRVQDVISMQVEMESQVKYMDDLIRVSGAERPSNLRSQYAVKKDELQRIRLQVARAEQSVASFEQDQATLVDIERQDKIWSKEWPALETRIKMNHARAIKLQCVGMVIQHLQNPETKYDALTAMSQPCHISIPSDVSQWPALKKQLLVDQFNPGVDDVHRVLDKELEPAYQKIVSEYKRLPTTRRLERWSLQALTELLDDLRSRLRVLMASQQRIVAAERASFEEQVSQARADFARIAQSIEKAAKSLQDVLVTATNLYERDYVLNKANVAQAKTILEQVERLTDTLPILDDDETKLEAWKITAIASQSRVQSGIRQLEVQFEKYANDEALTRRTIADYAQLIREGIERMARLSQFKQLDSYLSFTDALLKRPELQDLAHLEREPLNALINEWDANIGLKISEMEVRLPALENTFQQIKSQLRKTEVNEYELKRRTLLARLTTLNELAASMYEYRDQYEQEDKNLLPPSLSWPEWPSCPTAREIRAIHVVQGATGEEVIDLGWNECNHFIVPLDNIPLTDIMNAPAVKEFLKRQAELKIAPPNLSEMQAGVKMEEVKSVPVLTSPPPIWMFRPTDPTVRASLQRLVERARLPGIENLGHGSGTAYSPFLAKTATVRKELITGLISALDLAPNAQACKEWSGSKWDDEKEVCQRACLPGEKVTISEDGKVVCGSNAKEDCEKQNRVYDTQRGVCTTDCTDSYINDEESGKCVPRTITEAECNLRNFKWTEGKGCEVDKCRSEIFRRADDVFRVPVEDRNRNTKYHQLQAACVRNAARPVIDPASCPSPLYKVQKREEVRVEDMTKIRYTCKQTDEYKRQKEYYEAKGTLNGYRPAEQPAEDFS